MRILILIFLFLVSNLYSQFNLSFDKLYIECEDKWIASKTDDDSTYSYGYVYLDEEAGLTYSYEGTFKLNSDNTIEVNKLGQMIIYRVEPRNAKAAIIPESLFQELQVEPIPEWLEIYKKNTIPVKRLYRWGFTYNAWGMCDKALEKLLQAKTIDPDYSGLAVEIAYSYNCLSNFDKAVEVLSAAIKSEPENAYITKEYIYSLVRKKDIDKATEVYYNSVELEIDSVYNAANCFNIIGHYFYEKDKENFDKWVKELEKWPNNNKLIDKNIGLMKIELSK